MKSEASHSHGNLILPEFIFLRLRSTITTINPMYNSIIIHHHEGRAQHKHQPQPPPRRTTAYHHHGSTSIQYHLQQHHPTSWGQQTFVHTTTAMSPHDNMTINLTCNNITPHHEERGQGNEHPQYRHDVTTHHCMPPWRNTSIQYHLHAEPNQ
jgi:hypothetical protein